MPDKTDRHIFDNADAAGEFARWPGSKGDVLIQLLLGCDWPDSEDRDRIETETQGGE